MTGQESDERYCASCGTELPSGASFCPDCGSEDPAEVAGSSDYKEWAPGFKPGAEVRNHVVGVAYILWFPIGIALLLFGYVRRGPRQRRRALVLAGIVVVAFFGLGVLGATFAPDDATTSPSDSAGDTGGSDGGSGVDGDGTANVDPRLGEIDVDIQHDIGQNNVGFDVKAQFEDSARLTVQVTDGVGTAERQFEASTTSGTRQEFNGDIDPPDSLQDDETFRITFFLTVDGEVVDRRTLTETYSE